MSKQPTEEQINHLATVYNGCVNEDFDWLMSNFNYQDDADKIRKTLTSLGYFEMARTWERLLVLWLSVVPGFTTYTGKLVQTSLEKKVAQEKFKELEKEAVLTGIKERYCAEVKPILVEKFGEF